MPELDSKSIRLVPLGGLGEIGMNCLAIEQRQDILVLDCGTSFPQDDLGVDVLHPDFTWLVQRADRIRGVVLTHGHEDHIGAVPYLLREIGVPVLGPPHALGLVRHRLREHGFAEKDVNLRQVFAGESFSVGSFDVEPIRVAHSIVEATALRVRTVAGTVLHSGDFNFDLHPSDGEPTDESRLEQIGNDGVAVLLSDSTNVDVETDASSERDVAETLRRLVRQATGRVFVTLFASNIQRLISLGTIAQATRRKICLLGRSLSVQTDVAMQIGRLAWPSDLLVAPETARSMPPDSVLVLAGGTQGEPNSAMARLARGMHPDLRIEAGDTVILSSRVIPGNDRAVFSMMGAILRTGAILHTRLTERTVHTSGHASRPEQQRMLDLVRPRSFIPVHGTLHHLTRHAQVARDWGVRDVLVVENGTAVVFDGQRLRREEPVPSGVVAIGSGHEPLQDDLLRSRADLGRAGCVVVSLALDARRRVSMGPVVSTHGVQGASPRVLRDLACRLADTVTAKKRRIVEREGMADEIRRMVRRFFDRGPGAKPVVLVQFMDDDE